MLSECSWSESEAKNWRLRSPDKLGSPEGGDFRTDEGGDFRTNEGGDFRRLAFLELLSEPKIIGGGGGVVHVISESARGQQFLMSRWQNKFVQLLKDTNIHTRMRRISVLKGPWNYESENRGQIVTWTVIGCQVTVQCSAAELWLAAV